MKKTFTIILCVLGLSSAINAQYYHVPFASANRNPGEINNDLEYPVAGGISPGWTTIQGSSATPVWSPTQTIPFTFSFNGVAVTQFKVSTSGVLTFDVGTAVAAPTYTKAALPSALIPDNSVCIWGLAALGTNDNILTKQFGNAPKRQLWIQFSSYGYGTTPSDGSNFTYWSMVLEETSNNIYIVDNRTGGYAAAKNVSAGVQINSSTATSVPTSPNLLSLAGTSPTPSDNSYYQFTQGTQPAYDLLVWDITTSSYVVTGNNTISGVIKNIGTTTITSLTLNYTINGGPAVSDIVTGISIPPLSDYTFSQATPWNVASSGIYNLQCYASDLDGSNVDQNTFNDARDKVINVLTAIVIRIPLFEVFTSSTCAPCQPGNLNFHSIIDTINSAQHVSIKFQQDFPGTGDPYTTDESLNRRAFYAINSIPRMENDGGWDGNANSFTYQLYTDARAIPAQYDMIATYTEDLAAKTFSAKVLYSPLFDATGSQLYTAIIENTTNLNVKTNGETDFFHVMKKMLPDDNGTTLSNIPAGTWDSVSVTYTFNGNYRLPSDGQAANIIDNSIEHSVEQFNDLAMVGWIQDPAGVHQVFQACNFTKTTTIGIYEMNASVNSILIYPNPTNDYAAVEISLNQAEIVKIQLMDADGKSIESRIIHANAGITLEKFNVSNLAAGIYHVAVSDSKNNSFVKRIMVSQTK